MASNANTRRTAVQKEEIAATAATWSAPLKLGKLGRSGVLASLTVRAHTATGTSSVTAVDILVWMGSDDESGTTVANINDEDKAFLRTGIAVTGGTATAEEIYNIIGNTGGAFYDVRGDIDDPTQDGSLWLSIKPTGGNDTFTVQFVAADVK